MRFRAKLIEVEKPDNRLATMKFKRDFYVHSHLSQKLNMMKYNYVTLVECFHITNNLTDWDKKRRRTAIELDYSRKIDRRMMDKDTPSLSLR